MDFVEWAESSRWLLQRVMSVADDDFAKLENDIPNDIPSGSMSNAYTAASYSSPMSTYASEVATRPFLNKTSEAELYLLATNFLLCEL